MEYRSKQEFTVALNLSNAYLNLCRAEDETRSSFSSPIGRDITMVREKGIEWILRRSLLQFLSVVGESNVVGLKQLLEPIPNISDRFRADRLYIRSYDANRPNVDAKRTILRI